MKKYSKLYYDRNFPDNLIKDLNKKAKENDWIIEEFKVVSFENGLYDIFAKYTVCEDDNNKKIINE